MHVLCSSDMARGTCSLWSGEEVKTLIAVWGKEEIQSQLDGTTRNIKVYGRISDRLCEKGFERTAVQCREKMKKLNVSTDVQRIITTGVEEDDPSVSILTSWTLFLGVGLLLPRTLQLVARARIVILHHVAKQGALRQQTTLWMTKNSRRKSC